MLDELIERYGKGAVISVDRYVLDRDHMNTRWIVQIDGQDVPDVDVAIRGHGDLLALVLVNVNDELELWRWNPTRPNAAIKEPERIVDTLGGLRRRTGQ
jgi:hypothetical protein